MPGINEVEKFMNDSIIGVNSSWSFFESAITIIVGAIIVSALLSIIIPVIYSTLFKKKKR